jgi:hypothetical protein
LITLWSSWKRVLDNSRDVCKRAVPVTKKGATFFNTLKNLKVKIEIQRATDSFKNCPRLIS